MIGTSCEKMLRSGPRQATSLEPVGLHCSILGGMRRRSGISRYVYDSVWRVHMHGRCRLEMDAKILLCTDIGIFLHSDLVLEFGTSPWESAFVQWSTHFWSSDQFGTRTYIDVCCLPPLYHRPVYFPRSFEQGQVKPSEVSFRI